ncbi:MAG: ATP-binding protein [Acidobacteriota bacterium]
MLENLRLAVKKQKRLIIIFLLTIFIPSVTLSIFGIRAIRNERFRVAKQIENEHRRAAQELKSQVTSRLDELDILLKSLAQSSAFMQKDEAGIRNLIKAQLSNHPRIEHVFVTFNGAKPFFPLLQPAPYIVPSSAEVELEKSLSDKLQKAQTSEFKEKNYRKAVSLYKDLFDQSQEPNNKARMLVNMSRCLMKADDYRGAIQNYQRICENFQESVSPSGVPLPLISRLQMAICYRNLDQHQSSLQTSLNLYQDILGMLWPLTQAQFKTYATLVRDFVEESLSVNEPCLPLEDYKNEFNQLKNLHQEKLEQWTVITEIEEEIIPELQRRQNPSEYRSMPLQYHKTIDEKHFLISAVQIPDSPELHHPVGLLGVKIKEQSLIQEVIPHSIQRMSFSDKSDVVISHLSGDIFLGERSPTAEPATPTEYFEDNFPAWRIEIYRSGEDALGAVDLKRNFYFWTIITLVVVLISGGVLISRTIAQEMAVLKLKSDFVSSVSHEFKSPLTSIKALAERLRDGKVTDSDRMKSYFSVITQDVDRLTRLVRNILDFSKIEEGKKEYEFVETDVAQLVTQNIENFKREEIAKGVKITTRIPKNIPHLEIDEQALSQALNNLLDNAVKFSPDRKEVEVTLKKEGTNVILEVKDRGIGISSNELDKIFDKFYQGRHEVSQSAKGTGLGLTLVKHTVEAHKGRMEVKSRKGEGSTFSIILPIRK